MTFRKQFMHIISGRPAAGIQDWVQEGGCPQSAKAKAWPYSVWKALRPLNRER